MLMGFYELGVYGEEEADDFSAARNKDAARLEDAPVAAEPAPARPTPPAAPMPPVASAPASTAPVASATVEPNSTGTDFPESRPTEAQLQQLVQLLASPELDAEERTVLLSKPLDARPLSWVVSTLEKLPAVVAERKDPKKALAAAQNQLRTAAARHQRDMAEEAYRALLLRAQAITATPAQLRAEARAVLAQFQPVTA